MLVEDEKSQIHDFSCQLTWLGEKYDEKRAEEHNKGVFLKGHFSAEKFFGLHFQESFHTFTFPFLSLCQYMLKCSSVCSIIIFDSKRIHVYSETGLAGWLSHKS